MSKRERDSMLCCFDISYTHTVIIICHSATSMNKHTQNERRRRELALFTVVYTAQYVRCNLSNIKGSQAKSNKSLLMASHRTQHITESIFLIAFSFASNSVRSLCSLDSLLSLCYSLAHTQIRTRFRFLLLVFSSSQFVLFH